MANKKGGKNVKDAYKKKAQATSEPKNNFGKKAKSKKNKERAEKTDSVKKTGNSRADERRQGSARASDNTANKFRQGATSYILKDKAQTVTNIIATAPAKMASQAVKRSQDSAGYGNRGKSGQAHLTGGNHRNVTDVTKPQNKFKEEQQNREKVEKKRQQDHQKNGYEYGDKFTKAVDKTTKKIDKAFEKSKAKDINYAVEDLSDEKKDIPIYTTKEQFWQKSQVKKE